jgi:hypothetical protein
MRSAVRAPVPKQSGSGWERCGGWRSPACTPTALRRVPRPAVPRFVPTTAGAPPEKLMEIAPDDLTIQATFDAGSETSTARNPAPASLHRAEILGWCSQRRGGDVLSTARRLARQAAHDAADQWHQVRQQAAASTRLEVRYSTCIGSAVTLSLRRRATGRRSLNHARARDRQCGRARPVWPTRTSRVRPSPSRLSQASMRTC